MFQNPKHKNFSEKLFSYPEKQFERAQCTQGRFQEHVGLEYGAKCWLMWNPEYKNVPEEIILVTK